MQSREDFHMIKQLRSQGAYIVDIAHQIGCSERTVRRYLALPAPLTGKPKTPRGSKLDPFKLARHLCRPPRTLRLHSSH